MTERTALAMVLAQGSCGAREIEEVLVIRDAKFWDLLGEARELTEDMHRAHADFTSGFQASREIAETATRAGQTWGALRAVDDAADEYEALRRARRPLLIQLLPYGQEV